MPIPNLLRSCMSLSSTRNTCLTLLLAVIVGPALLEKALAAQTIKNDDLSKLSGDDIVGADEIKNLKVRLPVLWDKMGNAVAYVDIDPYKLDGVPTVTPHSLTPVKNSNNTTVSSFSGAERPTAYRADDVIQGFENNTKMRVYYPSQRWSSYLPVRDAYLARVSNVGIWELPKKAATWIFGPSDPLYIFPDLAPNIRVDVVISSSPAGALILVNGSLATDQRDTAIPTEFTGKIPSDSVHDVVLRKSGYRDCDSTSQMFSETTVPAHQVRISCNLQHN